MSTPRPTEADVEAIVEVIVGHQRIPTYRANGQRCSGCDHLRDETDGANSPRHARHVAEQILASDWLAARDAEHQREVETLRAEAEILRDGPHCPRCGRHRDWTGETLPGAPCMGCGRYPGVTAEADRDEARRELADLRAKVAALADEWEMSTRGIEEPDDWYGAHVRALLPTEDDQ